MDPARQSNKLSKRSLNAGDEHGAELDAQRAYTLASSSRRLAPQKPIAEHRWAMALKTRQHKRAQELFERALGSFKTHDPSNRIGRAILLRDYGLFLANELRLYDEGREKVEEARTILLGNFPADQEKRVALELLMVESFLYRIRLRVNHFDTVALFGLMEIDKRLREMTSTKPGYQFDNLVWILRYETDTRQVYGYLPRALALSVKLGNVKRVAEYTFMASGGQVLRAGLHKAFPP